MVFIAGGSLGGERVSVLYFQAYGFLFSFVKHIFLLAMGNILASRLCVILKVLGESSCLYNGMIY